MSPPRPPSLLHLCCASHHHARRCDPETTGDPAFGLHWPPRLPHASAPRALPAATISKLLTECFRAEVISVLGSGCKTRHLQGWRPFSRPKLHSRQVAPACILLYNCRACSLQVTLSTRQLSPELFPLLPA